MAKVVGADAGATYDVGIFDLQIGSMGGMAVTMSLRLDESVGSGAPRAGGDAARPRSPTCTWPRRSGADGWLVKPLDPLRIAPCGVTRRHVRGAHTGKVSTRCKPVGSARYGV